MIGQGKVVKITDFGLAGVLGPSRSVSGIRLNVQQGTVGLSGQTMEGTGFGTPTHMPPEQFTDAASCDERSDIYSFGVVLYQMASGGRLPFLAPLPEAVGESESTKFWREMHRLHARAPAPRLSSPLFPIIQRCLEKEPCRRYESFRALRGDLEPMLQHQAGATIRPPALNELDAWEWVNKGASFISLGQCDDGIRCCDKALLLAPRLAPAWVNKANILARQSRHEEAIHCCDSALEIDPLDAMAWANKGLSLGSIGRHQEAIRCYDKALGIDPRRVESWVNKGNNLGRLGLNEEAVRCYDRGLALDPLHPQAWHNKGVSLSDMDRFEEAIACYDKALELDPQYVDAWHNKGCCLGSLGRHEEAIRCFESALGLDPRNAKAWFLNGVTQERLGRGQASLRSYRKFISFATIEDAKSVEYAFQRVRELEGK